MDLEHVLRECQQLRETAKQFNMNAGILVKADSSTTDHTVKTLLCPDLENGVTDGRNLVSLIFVLSY